MADLTILFADQVGSTRQLSEIGDEAAVAVRQRLKRLLVSTIEGQAGRIFSDDGDGCAAVFERPEDAARAALLMLDGAAESRHVVDSKLAIHLRIGIHTGNVIPNGDGFVGMAVHLGARMCEVAPTDFVAASRVTSERLATTPWLRVTPFGKRTMKGVAEPVQVNLLSDSSRAAPTPEDQLASSGAEQAMPSSPWLRERPLPAVCVDRVAERSRLEASLIASEHQIQMVLLGGEPGAGKSTLIHQVATAHAANSDAICLVGRCDEVADGPYREVVEALHHLVEVAPIGLLAQHVLKHGSLLTRLIPGLEHRVASAPEYEAGRDVDRFRLYEAIADLLRDVARNQPVLLVFEDLHWASEPSLDLIRHLVRSAGLASVVIAGTYRSTEVDAEPHTLRFLERVGAEPNTARVELNRFDEAQAHDLVAQAASAAQVADGLIPGLVRHLYRQTAGSPLFLTEMLRSLEEAGTLRQLRDAGDIAAIEMPTTVQELATTRVDRLGADIAAVLADAAILGTSFRIPELERLAESNDFDILDVLEIAERAGIVHEEPSSLDGSFVFRHAVIHRALYDRIGTTRRRRRHRAAADAVTAVSEHDLKARSADILVHLERCGNAARPDELVRFASLAADEASDRIALLDAVRYSQVAADAVHQDPLADRAQIAEVLGALGAAQTAAGLAEGRASMVAAADAARTAERWDLFASAAFRYGGALKENQASPVNVATALVDEALLHFPEPSATRAKLLVVAALWRRQTTDYATRRPLADEALTIARSLDDPRTLALVMAEYHRALHGPNTMPEALEMADELESLAAQLKDDAVAFQALNLRLIATAELGMWEEAQQTAASLEQVGDRLRHIEGRRITLSWKISTSTAQGRFDDGAAHIAELKKLLSKYQIEDFGRMFGALSFVPLWLKGHSGLLYKASLKPGVAAAYSCAWFAADAGLLNEASSHIADLPDPRAVSERFDYMWWNDVVAQTRVALRTGDADLARVVYDIALPYADGNAVMGLINFFGTGRHHLGSLCMTLGDYDAAIANYEASLERTMVMGARPFHALTQAELAQALDSRGNEGDRERAKELRELARAVAEELELGLVIETLNEPEHVMAVRFAH